MTIVAGSTAARATIDAPISLSVRLKPIGLKLQAGLIHLAPLIVMLVVIGGVWQLATNHAGSGLPSPTKIWADSHDLILHPFYDHGGLDKGLGLHLFASLQRVALGFALAAIVGVGLGMLVGTSALAMRGLDPIFQVLRTVPPLAWLPLSLAAFRDAQPSAIFVIFITAIWPVIINTAVGVRNVPTDYRNVAKVIQLRGPKFFTKIVLPSAAPYIFTGLRIGIGLSWLAIVAAEMLIGGVGIGFLIVLGVTPNIAPPSSLKKPVSKILTFLIGISIFS